MNKYMSVDVRREVDGQTERNAHVGRWTKGWMLG